MVWIDEPDTTHHWCPTLMPNTSPTAHNRLPDGYAIWRNIFVHVKSFVPPKKQISSLREPFFLLWILQDVLVLPFDLAPPYHMLTKRGHAQHILVASWFWKNARWFFSLRSVVPLRRTTQRMTRPLNARKRKVRLHEKVDTLHPRWLKAQNQHCAREKADVLNAGLNKTDSSVAFAASAWTASGIFFHETSIASSIAWMMRCVS